MAKKYLRLETNKRRNVFIVSKVVETLSNLENSRRKAEFSAFLNEFGLMPLNAQIKRLLDSGYKFYFVDFDVEKSYATYESKDVVLGLLKHFKRIHLKNPSVVADYSDLLLILAHELAHILNGDKPTDYDTQEKKIEREIRADKTAFDILNIDENCEIFKKALELYHYALETYIKD